MASICRTIFILSILVLSQTACASTKTIEETVQDHFTPLIDKSQPKEKRFKSILIAVVTPFETKIIPIGSLDNKGSKANELTVFEIGSITKGFIGLLLANETLNGTINLDEPYNSKVPLKLPAYQDKEITWRQLAQHTGGVPRIPRNLKPSNPLQPYLDYDLPKLKDFISGFKLKSKPGVKTNYSNLGAGLASYGLEKMHSRNLERLLRENILEPLKMDDTRISLNSEQNNRLAPVYLNGEEVKTWQWQESSVLQGAGAIKSTIQDMTILMKTMMGLMAQDMLPVTQYATKPTFDDGKNSQIGLFWNRLKSENIVWHNGGTYGSSSFFGYDPDRLVGVIALSNSNIIDERGVDPRIDIASIKSILQIAKRLKVAKPIKVLKNYDNEVLRRIAEFEKTPSNIDDKEWVKLKLSHMFDMDQYMRNLFMTATEQGLTELELKFFQSGYTRRFIMMDWQNTQDLKVLLEKYGWFKISDWGKQVDYQAWLLVQHADNEPEFQKKVLKTLSRLYNVGETSPANYGYLYDRVATSSGDPSKRKPQKYGTQGQCVAPSKWEPFEIEDRKSVNLRRTEVGLPSLEEYITGFKDICK